MQRENSGAWRTFFDLSTLFFFWLVVFGGSLFQPALLDDADSVHAEAAREILIRNDWITLHVDGIRYLEKAPLLYWMMAGSFRIFGVHDWSARLPLALAALALMCSVYFLGRRMFAASAGFWAALACCIALGPYIFTRFLIPDLLVALWFAISLGFFILTFEKQQPARWTCWGFAACCALNVLTKGLIGLVFPAAAIGLYLLVTGQLRYLAKMRPFSSAAVFLLITAPWHIGAGLRNPSEGDVRGFFWFYFINEHFLRYLNKRVPRDYDTVPLLLFWGFVLVWLFPWSTFLPQALVEVPLFRRKDWASSQAARAKVVLLLGALFVLLFFSFSTRQEYYVLPALPALALLIGSAMAEEEASPATYGFRCWANVCSAVLAIVGLLAWGVTLFLALSSGPVAATPDIAELLHSAPAESQQYALSLGHFLDLNRRVMPLFRIPLLLFGNSLFVGAALNWYFRRRNQPHLGNWSLALMSVCLLVAVHLALVTFSPILTSKPLADAVARVYQPGDIIELNGEYEGGSTLNYYTGQQVRILNGRSANLWYGSHFPDAPQIFDDTDSFQRLWNGSQRVFLWTEAEKLDQAIRTLNPTKVFVLARSGGKLILTNRPPPRLVAKRNP
jgi:4-amino-4-deoxy-L-arabinose transferase-like glycosyltransferase